MVALLRFVEDRLFVAGAVVSEGGARVLKDGGRWIVGARGFFFSVFFPLLFVLGSR